MTGSEGKRKKRNELLLLVLLLGFGLIVALQNGWISGGTVPFGPPAPASSPFASASPSPTYYYTPVPSPTYTTQPTPTPTRPPAYSNYYMILSMSPNPCKLRDVVTGTVITDASNVDVTIQYFRVGEGIQYQIPVHITSGSGTFNITFTQAGEWHFWGEFTDWTLYGEVYSNSVVEMVF